MSLEVGSPDWIAARLNRLRLVQANYQKRVEEVTRALNEVTVEIAQLEAQAPKPGDVRIVVPTGQLSVTDPQTVEG